MFSGTFSLYIVGAQTARDPRQVFAERIETGARDKGLVAAGWATPTCFAKEQTLPSTRVNSEGQKVLNRQFDGRVANDYIAAGIIVSRPHVAQLEIVNLFPVPAIFFLESDVFYLNI